MSWPEHVVVPYKKFSTFLRASSLLSELKAFSASLNSLAYVSDFSNSFLKLWIAYSIPHVWPMQISKNFPRFLRSNFMHLLIVLQVFVSETGLRKMDYI